jgi:ribosomal-protein-alanine N-acetyltransferase
MLLGRVVAEDAEVLTLCVVPDQRRQGLGATLLAAALGHAARSGANAMFLEVSVSNAVAIRLYQRIGFLVVGQRRRYYADGTDALVMRVAIDPAAGRDAAGPSVARKH